MTAHPIPSEFERRTNATYEALMWGLSRPGLPRRLPAAGQEGIIETLIDRECAVYTDDTTLAAALSRAGADLVTQEDADHLFLTQAPELKALSHLRQGSDLYPDDGATLVICVSLGHGEKLRLSGPGVDGTVDILVSGLPKGFWDARLKAMRYPMGFELFLLDKDQVIGIPRSTSVEVL